MWWSPWICCIANFSVICMQMLRFHSMEWGLKYHTCTRSNVYVVPNAYKKTGVNKSHYFPKISNMHFLHTKNILLNAEYFDFDKHSTPVCKLLCAILVHHGQQGKASRTPVTEATLSTYMRLHVNKRLFIYPWKKKRCPSTGNKVSKATHSDR